MFPVVFVAGTAQQHVRKHNENIGCNIVFLCNGFDCIWLLSRRTVVFEECGVLYIFHHDFLYSRFSVLVAALSN